MLNTIVHVTYNSVVHIFVIEVSVFGNQEIFSPLFDRGIGSSIKALLRAYELYWMEMDRRKGLKGYKLYPNTFAVYFFID